jgi:hypothetical protein
MTETGERDERSWSDLRERRMAEPGAREAYDAARLAFELDTARTLPLESAAEHVGEE